MIDLTRPVTVHWELNNICNLMCPQCSRNIVKDGVLQWNKDLGITLNNKDTSLEDFKISFNNIDKVNFISFYGTASENVLSKDFFEINEFIINSGVNITTSTNGSIRPAKWWKELGKLYHHSKSSKIRKIVFCLDGLREELSLYRINASYDKIIENARAFIDAGGNAEWRMIVFKHNQHQIEEAEELSRKYGFKYFSLQYSIRKDIEEPFTYKDKSYELLPQDIWKEWEHTKKERNVYTKSGNISCKFQARNSIAVDFNNRVWPCCWLHGETGTTQPGQQKFYDDYFYDKSNNLLEKSLEEIMNDPFWDILQMSWDEESACLPACSSTCSFHNNDWPPTNNFKVNVYNHE